MIEIRVSTYGDAQQMSGMIRGVKVAVQNLRPAFPHVVRRLKAQLARHFKAEGGGSPSGRWEPLSPSYAARKQRRFPGRPILEATGLLKESLVGSGTGSIVVYGARSVFVGSAVSYGIYHQTGTGSMPRRAPIEPTDRDVAEWITEIWRHVEREGTKLGWRGRFQGAMAGV